MAHEHDKPEHKPNPCGCGQPDCGDVDAFIAKHKDKFASTKLRETRNKVASLSGTTEVTAELDEHLKAIEQLERANVGLMMQSVHVRRVQRELARRLTSHKLVPREAHDHPTSRKG